MKNINLEMGIHNRFDIEVIDAVTGKVKETAQAFNVICDTWWSQFFGSTEQIDGRERPTSIVYGTGTGTPSASDTTLFAYSGTASDDSNDGAYASIDVTSPRKLNMIATLTLKRVLRADMAVGVNITEVGIGTQSTIYNHAMLQDMNGNPISIQKTNTDVINIYARIYLHWNQNQGIYLNWTGDNNCVSLIGAILYGFQPASHSAWSKHFLAEEYSDPRVCIAKNRMRCGWGNVASYKTLGFWTSNLTNKTTTTPTVRFDVNDANIGGCNLITIICGRYGSYNNRNNHVLAIETGTTLFPAYSITSESVGIGDGTTKKFKTKFDFPYNATVKVNGSTVSGVTVKKLPPRNDLTDHIGIYYVKPVVTSAPGIPYVNYTNEDWPIENAIPRSYDCIYENTVCEATMTSIALYNNQTLSFSNDAENWTSITGNGRVSVPAACGNMKYIKCIGGDGNAYDPYFDYDGYNIIFDTAPAQGDVITIDYDTDYIPKDSDHVLDVTITLTFSNYSE